jgi:hypothetical protein
MTIGQTLRRVERSIKEAIRLLRSSDAEDDFEVQRALRELESAHLNIKRIIRQMPDE